MADTAAIPSVAFGEHQITRLMSGGNPLCGNSHWSPARNKAMREYFTPEHVVSYLHDVQRAGINTIQARGDYCRILHWLELFRREGGKLHWIAQTASEMADVFTNIRVLAAAGAIGIYHHGSQTDTFWREGRIDEAEDYLKVMRDCGVRVGLGTHIPEVIEYAEEKDWDVDFYMACVYNLSRKPRESALVAGTAEAGATGAQSDDGPTIDEQFIDEDRARMFGVIQKTSKQCLAFKILGAGRKCATQDDVKDAFAFAFQNIKPQDAVVVGMYPKNENQIELNVRYTLDAIAR